MIIEKITLVLVVGAFVMWFELYSDKKSGYNELFVSKTPLLKRKLHEYSLVFRGAFFMWATLYLMGSLK